MRSSGVAAVGKVPKLMALIPKQRVHGPFMGVLGGPGTGEEERGLDGWLVLHTGVA